MRGSVCTSILAFAIENRTMSEVLKKALSRNSKWEDKDHLLDVVYWSRQVLALVVGLFWGLFSIKGIFGILIYCAITTLLMNFYVVNFQGQDLDNYGGFMELAKEGFMSAFASFLVMWIIVYSSFYD